MIGLVAERSTLQLSFFMTLQSVGRPDLDSWTWERAAAISLRLVVDGRVLYAAGDSMDALVRVDGDEGRLGGSSMDP